MGNVMRRYDAGRRGLGDGKIIWRKEQREGLIWLTFMYTERIPSLATGESGYTPR